MGKRERICELDFVRTLAMLGVISLHVSSTFVYAQSGFALPGGLTPALLANQLPRYSVPIFVLLSGLSLGLGPAPESWSGFAGRRFAKQLPPYIVWSVIYWLLNFPGAGPASLVTAILEGMASSHLYFILVMLQLYLLYPLLRRAADREPAVTLIVTVLVSFVFQQGIWEAGVGMGSVAFFLNIPFWKTFLTWIGFFAMGLSLARLGAGRLCAWAGRQAAVLAPAAALFGLWYCYESKATNSIAASTRASLFLYTPLVLLAILGLANRLKGAGWLTRAMTFCARHSMTVYYSHLVVLRYLRRVPLFTVGTRGMLLLLIAESILSIALAWLIDLVLGAIPRPAAKAPALSGTGSGGR